MCDSKNEKRLSEIVFDYIVKNILNRSFKPNERIVERKIATDLGISHVPVREALERLENDGWVQRFSNRGARIKEFNKQEIKDLFQLRQAIECGSVLTNEYPLSEENKVNLANSFNAFETTFGGGDVEAAVKADSKFHQAIVQCSNNKKMIAVHRTTVQQLRYSFPIFLFGALDLAFSGGVKYEELQLKSHKNIYLALVNSQKNKAAELLGEHIENSFTSVKILADFKDKLEKVNMIS